MSIYEQHLQESLTLLRREVASLGVRILKAQQEAVHALVSGNEPRANAVILQDQRINRQVRCINRLGLGFIVRHMPGSKHLRLIVSVLRLVNEMERIGDYAVSICRISLNMGSVPEAPLKEMVDLMASHASTMLQQALTAFNEDNGELARGTMLMADQMDKERDMTFKSLVKMGKKGHTSPQTILSMNAIFYMLERVSDRAKNICEETLFVVAGETKPEERWSILFLDEDNGIRSQIAEVIAKKNFPNSGTYYSAGRTPLSRLPPHLVEFMSRRGIDMQGMHPKGMDAITPNMDNIDLVVSLQGPVRSYPFSIPFHTAFLTWDLTCDPTDNPEEARGEDQEQLATMVREITLQIHDLMDTLRGEEAI